MNLEKFGIHTSIFKSSRIQDTIYHRGLSLRTIFSQQFFGFLPPLAGRANKMFKSIVFPPRHWETKTFNSTRKGGWKEAYYLMCWQDAINYEVLCNVPTELKFCINNAIKEEHVLSMFINGIMLHSTQGWNLNALPSGSKVIENQNNLNGFASFLKRGDKVYIKYCLLSWSILCIELKLIDLVLWYLFRSDFILRFWQL